LQPLFSLLTTPVLFAKPTAHGLCDHNTPACHLCLRSLRAYHAGHHHLRGKTCNVLPNPNCRELVLPNLTRSTYTTSPGLLPPFLSERILLALCSVLAIDCHLEIGLATIRATHRRQPIGDRSVLPRAHLQEHSSPATRPAEAPTRLIPTLIESAWLGGRFRFQTVQKLHDEASCLALLQAITTASLQKELAPST
jgi:hypothetical protein